MSKPMTISRTAFLVSIVTLASACATPSQRTKASGSAPVASAAEAKTQQKSDGYDHVVCDTETTVGSHIPETVCRSVEMTDQNRRRTQDEFNRMLQHPGTGTGPGN